MCRCNVAYCAGVATGPRRVASSIGSPSGQVGTRLRRRSQTSSLSARGTVMRDWLTQA